MAVTTFIPEVWSARLLTDLSKALVLGALANRDYEGEISRAGDTVNINSITDPTISTYTPNSTTISPEQLTTANQALLIDQQKYFAFYVDDVDARQAAGDLLNVAAQRAAYGLRDAADQYLAGLVTGAHADNTTAATEVGTGDAAYSALVTMKIQLDEKNVPTEGRWAGVPPWFHGLLLESSKFIDASASGSTDPLRNGLVGRAAGFDIHVSNNLTTADTGDDTEIMAGHPMSITYAEQIVKTEAYRPEDAFSDAIKGLHVYGAKVVRPEALARYTASQSAVV